MASRTLTVTLLGDAKDAISAFEQTEKSAGNMGKTIATGLAVAGAAIVGAGAVALKFAGDFDNAYDTIRTGTGATGEALEGLQDDFKEVVKNVPTDFDTASTAIADLNTRLGSTGEQLQDSAEQFINLSRVTGTDLASNIANATRVFGDWDVAAEDQASTMDALFRATQVSGIGFDQLTSSVVQFGAPLRSMGFSLEESTAMLAKWEKEGVNTERILGSLSLAANHFAEEGVDMKEGLAATIEEIKNAGSSSEALAIAQGVVGSRAANDFQAAVREGRFELEDYIGAIEDGQDTINGAAEDTDDWREKLTLLKNRGLVAIEPLLMRFFDGVGQLADGLVRLGEPLGNFIGDIKWVIENGGGFNEKFSTGVWATLAEAIGVVAIALRDDIIPALRTFSEDVLGALSTTFSNDIQPKLEAFAAVMRDPVIPAVLELGGFVKDNLLPPVKAFIEFLANNKEFIVGFGVAIAVGVAPAFVAWAVAAGAAALATIAATAPVLAITVAIAALVGGIIWLVRNWDIATEAMGRFARFVGDKLSALMGWMRDQFFAFLDSKFAWFAMILGPVGILVAVYKFRDEIGRAFSAAAGWVGDRFAEIGGFIDTLKGALDGLVGFFGGLPDRIGSGLSTLASKMSRPFVEAFDGIKEIINGFIRKWNSLEIHVPSVDVPLVGTLGGFGVGTPNIPEFDTGGIVPGRLGQPLPILAHGGETVLPTHRRDFDGGDRVFEVRIPIEIDGRVIDERIVRVNERELTRGNRLAGGRA